MERLHRVVGPVRRTSTSSATRHAARRSRSTPRALLAWLPDELAARDWTLKLIVSTHGHWDHIGDNAAVRSTPVPRSRSTRSTRPADGPGRACRSRSAVGAGSRARGGRRDPVRRDPSARSSTRPVTRRAPCASRRGRGSAVQRRHAVRRRAGARRPAGRVPEPMVESLDRLRALRRRPARPPGHGDARRSAASGPGWTSSAKVGAFSRVTGPTTSGVGPLRRHDRDPARQPSPAGGSARPRPASATSPWAASRR